MEKHIILSAPGNEIRFYNEYESLDAAIDAIKNYFGLYSSQIQIRYEKDENQTTCAFVNIWNRFFVVRNKESYESTEREKLTWTEEQRFRHEVMEKFKTRRFVKCYRICHSWQGDLIDKTKTVVSSVTHDSATNYGAIEMLEDAKIILAGFAAKQYATCDESQRANACEGAIGYIVDSVTAQMDALIDGCCTMPNGIVYKINETLVPEPRTEDEWDDTERFPLLYNRQCADEFGNCAVGDVDAQIARYRDLLSKLEQKSQAGNRN